MSFHVSPSMIARYFFHNCERFLRYRASPREESQTAAIPAEDEDSSAVMRAIFEHGYVWEREVLGKLAGAVAIAPATDNPDPIHRHFGWDESLALLRSEPAGRFIYQPTLRAPSLFYRQYGLDPDQVFVSDNRPDLIRVLSRDGGGRLFRVIDVKRATALKLMHRIQVLLYVLQLDAIVAEYGIADASVDLRIGEVWLAGLDQPAAFDLELVRRPVEQFLRDDLKRIVNNPADQAFWHLFFRCEWCEYFQHCYREMQQTNDVSRVANLSISGKRFLVRELQVRTVPQFNTLLASPEADEKLGGCPPLRGRTHTFRKQTDALLAEAPEPTGGASFAMPKFEHVRLLMTAQAEPLYRCTYLAGVLVNTYPDKAQAIFGQPKLDAFVRIATSPRPDDLAAVRRQFINHLYDVLQRVDVYNRPRPWTERVSLQAYVYTNRERELLVEMFLQALAEPDLAEQAMALLLFLQGPDLLLTDDHPEAKVPLPIIVVLTALGQLLAMPIAVSYQLSAVEDVLLDASRNRNYKRDTAFEYPLGHGIRPDRAHVGWRNKSQADLDAVRQRARRLLFALNSVVQELRKRAKDDLATDLPSFHLENPINVRDPLLSRLVFLTEYEAVLACREIRDGRGNPRPIQLHNEEAVELEVLAATPQTTDCRVTSANAVELGDDYPNWLLVRDTADGRRTQLQFNDYRFRKWVPAEFASEHLGVGSLETLTADDEAFTATVRVHHTNQGRPFATGSEPAPGDRLVLMRRFSDINTGPVASYLRRIDGGGPRTFRDLLHHPERLASPHPLPSAVRDLVAAQAASLGLLATQTRVYDQLCSQRLLALWGPPGTGKTHFLATIVLGLARAHYEAGLPFRVWVTAFTHVAIENLLRKVVSRAAELGIAPPPLAKVRRWDSPTGANGIDLLERYSQVIPWLDGSDPLKMVCIVGATAYAGLREHRGFRGIDHFEGRFDLMIVDEASQIPMGLAALPVNGASAAGRVVLAGDHLQLPPVMKGVYPEEPEGQPPLHRSVFEVAQRAAGQCLSLCGRLTDNFRMNDVLTSFAAATLYGPEYHCANTGVAGQRLRLAPDRDVPGWVEACLRPSHPMVIVIEENLPPGSTSPLEASLVGELVRGLRQTLCDAGGQPYPRSESGELRFYKEGVFIVSPHHDQIRLLRRSVRRATGDAHPFVDTVDKMQGQEAEAVVVSYGVSDAEHAAAEGEFLYNVNRLNVSITRAKSKTVLFLARQFLDGLPQLLDVPEAERGLAYMQGIVRLAEEHGERSEHIVALGEAEVRLTVVASDKVIPVALDNPLLGDTEDRS